MLVKSELGFIWRFADDGALEANCSGDWASSEDFKITSLDALPERPSRVQVFSTTVPVRASSAGYFHKLLVLR